MRCSVLLLAVGSALFIAAPRAQDRISVLQGAQAGALELRVFVEGSVGATTALSKLKIEPIEISNRLAQHALDPSRAHIAERNGLARVELPGGGRVFAYSRDSGRHFGYLLIQPSGVPIVLLELPATTSGNPFKDRIGVGARGQFAAVTTVAGALYLLRLDGGSFGSSGPRRVLSYKGEAQAPSLSVGGQNLYFVTGDDRIWRCALDATSQPIDVTPSGQSGWRLKDELAMSGDGKTVVFLFGAKDSMFLWRVGGGNAVRLSLAAAKYEEPGYLPDAEGGPRMMLNHDGSRLLYTDSTSRDEIFVADIVGSAGTLHLTSDGNFKPYIGTGVIPSFIKNDLAIAIGDPAKLDYYIGSVGAAAVVNVTGTAAESKPPFGTGTLAVRTGHELGAGLLLVTEGVGAAGQVRLIDVSRQKAPVVATHPRARIERGDALTGTASVLVPSMAGDVLLDGTTGARILQGPPGIALTPEIQTGSFAVFTAADANGSRRIVARTGALLLVFGIEPGLRQISATRSGGGIVNAATLRYVTPTGPVTLDQTAPVIRVVISGAGG